MDNSVKVKQWIYVFLAFSMFLRLIMVLITLYYHQHIILAPDSGSYMNSADALLRTGHFAVSPGDSNPQVFRTPGNPVFLAMVIWLFGKKATSL
jgi:hypothetical protein